MAPNRNHASNQALSSVQASPKSLQRTTGIWSREHTRRYCKHRAILSITHQIKPESPGRKKNQGKIGSGLSPHDTKSARHKVKAHPSQSMSGGWCGRRSRGGYLRAAGMKQTTRVCAFPRARSTPAACSSHSSSPVCVFLLNWTKEKGYSSFFLTH